MVCYIPSSLSRSKADHPAERYNFLQSQISTFRLCDSYFRFHICEYRLLFTARYEAPGQVLDTSQPSPLSVAFSECVDAALGVAMVVQNDFVPYGYLPYCFNLTWIALAVNCIWLIKVSSSPKSY